MPLAALLVQAALGEHGQRRRKRQSMAPVSSNVSVSSAAATLGGTDSGARHRLRLVDSGNYLRCVQGAVTTGRFFFTLIEVRRLPDTDAVLLLCHGVGPLGLGPGNELTDGRPRIAVAGTASQPQRFWLKPTGEGYALLLEPTEYDRVLNELNQELLKAYHTKDGHNRTSISPLLSLMAASEDVEDG